MNCKRILKLAIVMGLFLSLLPACAEIEEVQPLVLPIKKVEIVEIVAADFQETFVVSSLAEAAINYRLSAEVGGRFKSKRIHVGDLVTEGQVLFEIDSEPFHLNLRQTKARAAQTTARVTFTEAELKRKKPLFKSKTLSQSGWEQLQLDSASAQAEKDQAEVALAQAKRDLRLTRLRSPIKGRILEDYYEVGEILSPGSVLAWIADSSKIVFEIGASDRELRYLHIGDEVQVEVDAFPGQTFDGRIAQVSANASPETGNFPVEVSVNNPLSKIVPGMVARLALPGAFHKDAIRIPLMALHQEAGNHFVFVVDGNRSKRVIVVLGSVFGDHVRVTSGLQNGNQLIVLSQRRLLPGDEIELVR